MFFDMEKPKVRESYNLLIGLVAPRPIALVTSMNEDGGLNAAPFSSYNYLCTDPPIIGMGVTNRPNAGFVPKDTARNIRRTGEFVVNVVTEDLMPRMNICATDFPMPGVHDHGDWQVADHSGQSGFDLHRRPICRSRRTVRAG